MSYITQKSSKTKGRDFTAFSKHKTLIVIRFVFSYVKVFSAQRAVFHLQQLKA